MKETIASKTFTFSNGFVGLDGNYRIAVGYPVTNLENGQYMGLIVPLYLLKVSYRNMETFIILAQSTLWLMIRMPPS